MGRRGIATTGTSFRATGTRADARWSAGTRAGRAGTSSIVWGLSFFPPCNHNINIYKKNSFSGEVKDSVIFLFFFYFIGELNLYSPSKD